MSGYSVSFAGLAACGDAIQQVNTDVRNVLTSMRQQVEPAQRHWDGDAKAEWIEVDKQWTLRMQKMDETLIMMQRFINDSNMSMNKTEGDVKNIVGGGMR